MQRTIIPPVPGSMKIITQPTSRYCLYPIARFRFPSEVIDLRAEQVDLLKFAGKCFPSYNDVTIRDSHVQKVHLVSRSYLLLCHFRWNRVYDLDILIQMGHHSGPFNMEICSRKRFANTGRAENWMFTVWCAVWD